MMNFKDLVQEAKGEFPENFDNLILQSARNCPRNFFFRHVLNLVPQGVPEMGMKAIFGIALHKGVERLWHGDSGFTAEEDQEEVAGGERQTDGDDHHRDQAGLAVAERPPQGPLR